MIDVRGLKAEMVKSDVTQKDVAKHLGISARTFSNKLKKGVFGSDEIEKMIELLNIKNPVAIFFAHLVTFKDTKSKTS